MIHADSFKNGIGPRTNANPTRTAHRRTGKLERRGRRRRPQCLTLFAAFSRTASQPIRYRLSEVNASAARWRRFNPFNDAELRSRHADARRACEKLNTDRSVLGARVLHNGAWCLGAVRNVSVVYTYGASLRTLHIKNLGTLFGPGQLRICQKKPGLEPTTC